MTTMHNATEVGKRYHPPTGASEKNRVDVSITVEGADGEDALALLAVDVSPRDENVFDDPELINPDDHITASGRVFVDGIPAEDVNHVETVVV